MSNPLLFLAVFSVCLFLGEWLLRRKLHIPKEHFFRAYVNKVHIIGTVLIIIAILAVGGIVLFRTYNFRLAYSIIWSGFLLNALFSAFMHYKYNKASKEYIIDIMESVFIVIGFAGMWFFLFPYLM